MRFLEPENLIISPRKTSVVIQTKVDITLKQSFTGKRISAIPRKKFQRVCEIYLKLLKCTLIFTGCASRYANSCHTDRPKYISPQLAAQQVRPLEAQHTQKKRAVPQTHAQKCLRKTEHLATCLPRRGATSESTKYAHRDTVSFYIFISVPPKTLLFLHASAHVVKLATSGVSNLKVRPISIKTGDLKNWSPCHGDVVLQLSVASREQVNMRYFSFSIMSFVMALSTSIHKSYKIDVYLTATIFLVHSASRTHVTKIVP